MGNKTAASNDVRNGRKRQDLFNLSIFTLLTEVGLNFFRFLRSLGISGDPNLVILSSRDSYACDENKLKNVRIIINLKKLNFIKHLDLFLNSLVRILPPNTSFIGYFSDAETLKGSGFNTGNVYRLLQRVFNLFGSTVNHNMSRNEVAGLLEKNGFKTLSMKDMNGFTYFISQNVSLPQ